MIELNLLALAYRPFRLLQPGYVRVTRTIPSPPEQLYALLSDLDNHWKLAERYVDVVRLDGPPGGRHGGVVRLRGPLGLRRAMRTRVVVARPPRLMVGRAQLGRRTRASVSWALTPSCGRTEVELAAVVEPGGTLDYLLLLLGGKRWLERRFEATLARLAELAVGSTERIAREPTGVEPDAIQRLAA